MCSSQRSHYPLQTQDHHYRDDEDQNGEVSLHGGTVELPGKTASDESSDECADRCERGNIEDEALEPYRKDMQGQFVVYSSQPFIGGGLFLQIVFIDKPENIFRANVYSDVDMQREVVTGYHVQYMDLDKEKNESTKQEMLQIMKEHPELKLW